MSQLPRIMAFLLSLVGAITLAACGDDATDSSGDVATSGQKFPEIVKVVPTKTDDGVWDFAVTISSTYDTPERYADGWQVLGPNGESLGEMTLDHDHASEQPFTRDQIGVEIPAEVGEVKIEGHDLANGYGGKTQTVALDG